jgi:two-component system chemotaxis sensor kinase CheA
LGGGVSTARVVTGESGRGVGLEAVRVALESIDGEVAVRSAASRGTTVELRVPISLAAIVALTVHGEGTTVLIPLESIRKVVRVARDDISRDAEDGERLLVDGVAIPFVPLRCVLQQPSQDIRTRCSAVIVEFAGECAAIGVERLGGTRRIVIRTIPRHAAVDSVVSGAAFDDEGVPRLVLAPGPLLRAAASARPSAQPMPREVALPVLVIDDSLTTRMLEQSILQSAGYTVDLAVSAEDGLEKARGRRYGVFVVDVEMPGMDGFEFIEATRRDPKLRDIPSILVTSRADADDKRRGKDVGARAYIVKSEFDQAVLLDAIGRFVG